MASDAWVPCPHCGEEIRESARFCRHCGADDRTGFLSEEEQDAARWSEGELPDRLTDEDYEAFLAEEGLGGEGSRAPRRAPTGIPWWAWFVAVALILAFLLPYLRAL